jgi:hypothetical protein
VLGVVGLLCDEAQRGWAVSGVAWGALVSRMGQKDGMDRLCRICLCRGRTPFVPLMKADQSDCGCCDANGVSRNLSRNAVCCDARVDCAFVFCAVSCGLACVFCVAFVGVFVACVACADCDV